MTRPAWIAIIMAIAFPSIALIVVLFIRPPPPAAPPLQLPNHSPHDKRPEHPPSKFQKPPPFPEETLIHLRKELSLSDDQVESIRKIAEPARERLVELDEELFEKERALGDLLHGDDVEIDLATKRMNEISQLRAERDTIIVITPLRLRQVLNAEQRSKAVELWRRHDGPNALGKHPPHDGPHHGPPHKVGPPGGKHPPFGKPPPPPPPGHR